LPAPGAPIAAGVVEIGTLGSIDGERGLALVRIDRVPEFAQKGEALRAGDVPVRIELPSWATFSLAPTPAPAGTPAA
jgi:tRNA-modifying protein YgfZ